MGELYQKMSQDLALKNAPASAAQNAYWLKGRKLVTVRVSAAVVAG